MKFLFSKKDTGKKGEDIACEYLKKLGWHIIERNYHYSRYAEIDIVAKEHDTLVFVEVKTRSAGAIARPMEFVDGPKRRRIQKTAMLYLASHPTALQPRFDVIEVMVDGKRSKIRHLENAFGAEDGYAAF